MALIGLATVTVVAMLAGVRVSRLLNKLLILALWAVYAAYSLGWTL